MPPDLVRLLVVVPSLAKASGGPSYSVPALCDSLADLGVQVALSSIQTTPDSNVPSNPNVRLHLIADSGFGVLSNLAPGRLVRALRTLIYEKNTTVVHSHGLWTGLNRAAIEAAREAGIPFIISPRGMLSPWALGRKAWRKKTALLLYERRNLSESNVLHATSDLEASEMRELGLRNPIAVIPNGVEMPKWSESVHSIGSRIALFLSRIHPKKGLLDLVHAWAVVRPPGWRCVVAGPDEGSHRVEVENAIRAKRLGDDFAFLGPVEGSAKWELYQSASIFVLPTKSENFGLAVAEALACGVPVLTTKAAPWSLLEQERCGWWIEPDLEALETALRAATQVPAAELREMGFRGRKAVEARFAWPHIAVKMLDVYRWMCDGGGAPNCVELLKA